MPYFSFTLNTKINKKTNPDLYTKLTNFTLNTKYYSKNTILWKLLNKNKKLLNISQLNIEKRTLSKSFFNSILFCLPPNIGLGDSIEYALGIKSILVKYPNKKIGVAFVGNFNNIFSKYFCINDVFNEISEQNLLLYDTVFHFTLEIKEFKFQKYDRQNIEKIITKYFGTSLYRKKINFSNKTQINKNMISIFPLSLSPIRTMPIDILNGIIGKYVDEYEIEIFLYNSSMMSKYIERNIKFSNKIILHTQQNLNQLLSSIKNINFGIFVDSGPLHVAKILYKKGVLITSSVSEKILLYKFNSIQSIKSNYTSDFCPGQCGLVNVFNIKNNIGCYDTLSIKKENVLSLNNLNKLQRGNLKENYLNIYNNPVKCFKSLDVNKINLFIKEVMKK